MDVLAEKDTVFSPHHMGRTQQRRAYHWIFTQHPKKRTCLLQRIKSFVLRKDPETLLKAKRCGVPCYAHLKTKLYFPKQLRMLESQACSWRLSRKDAEEIITFPIYPLFFNSSSFHYIANSFGHSSTASYVYSIKLLRINEVGVLLISKGPFAQHTNSNTALYCQGSLGRGNIISV